MAGIIPDDLDDLNDDVVRFVKLHMFLQKKSENWLT